MTGSVTPSQAKKPFRLIFHIGAGKTGTSSIQQTLVSQRDKLKAQGFWYLGMMLEHSPAKKLYAWQQKRGSDQFFALSPELAGKELQNALTDAVTAVRGQGFHTAIWSNEWFFRRGAVSIAAVETLAKSGVEVQIIAYVRRHDAWARSAYVQWGLKHKTYLGRLKPFNLWCKQNLGGFANYLRQWQSRFPEHFTIRNLDVVGDGVADFLRVVGLDGAALMNIRTNETPPPEELVLQTLFNEKFGEKVKGSKFAQTLTGDISFDRPIDRVLETLLPSAEDLKEVAAIYAEDRDLTNAILAEYSQPPLEETPLTEKPMQVDIAKVTTAIFQIVLNQSTKLQEMHASVEALQKKLQMLEENNQTKQHPTIKGTPVMSKESPVFAISTGRSGSTLVQRVLNCHPDLVLWGEHHGFLNGFATGHAHMNNIQRVKFPQIPSDNKGPQQLLPTLSDPDAPLEWANPWSLEEFEAKARDFVRDYFGSRLAEGQRWGFKEIRYNSMPALNMLRALFPQGKFVFIQRDPIEVTRSKVFAFIKESNWLEMNDKERRKRVGAMLKEVRDHYQVYKTFMKQHAAVGLVVDYESLVKAPREVIKVLLEHLELDATRYDWELAEQVMSSIITSTKRDEALVEFIKEVDRSLV